MRDVFLGKSNSSRGVWEAEINMNGRERSSFAHAYRRVRLQYDNRGCVTLEWVVYAGRLVGNGQRLSRKR